ncbi:MAG: hypothetical protein ACYTG2_14280 [Planctomycetota bacterium]
MTDDTTSRPVAGFARLSVPARVQPLPRAEELVSVFDERIDERLFPAAVPTRRSGRSTVATAHAGALRLPIGTTGRTPEFGATHRTITSPGFSASSYHDDDSIAERHMRLVVLAPWRTGVELFSTRGLSLLVGSQSLVDESERDPVTIEHQRSAFEGDDVAVLGLRLRY